MCLIPAVLCKASRVFTAGASNSTEKYVIQPRQVKNKVLIVGIEPNDLSRSILSYTPKLTFSIKMALHPYYIINLTT